MKRLFTAAMFFSVLTANGAQAQIVEWTGNGHFYEVVPDLVRWSDARAAADAMTHPTLGWPGHLVTITTPQENAFVATLLPIANEGYHLGALQPAGSAEPNGEWGWVNGEPWAYTNWVPGEPNDGLPNQPNGPEDFLSMYGGDASVRGLWNDIPDPGDTYFSKYVVEYEAIPLPATLPAGIALLGAFGLARRRLR